MQGGEGDTMKADELWGMCVLSFYKNGLMDLVKQVMQCTLKLLGLKLLLD